jgi:hypothetical protein
LALRASGNNTHDGTPGFSLDLTVTSASRGQGFIISSNGSGGSSFDSRLVAGNWYQCGFELRALTELSSFNVSGQVFLNFGGGNAPSVYFMMNNNFRYENGMPLGAGESFDLISQPFYVPQRPTCLSMVASAAW